MKYTEHVSDFIQFLKENIFSLSYLAFSCKSIVENNQLSRAGMEPSCKITPGYFSSRG